MRNPASPYFTGVAGVSPPLRFLAKPPNDHMLDHNGERGIIQLNNAKSKPSVSRFDLERKKEGADVQFCRQAETERSEFLLTNIRV